MASTKVPSELIANTAILGQHLHTTLGNTGVTANSSGLFIGQPVATSDTVQFQTVTGSHAGTIAAATTGTTQANTDSSAKIATTEFVTNKITQLIGGAPSTLNDLNELAAAINDDASYNSTLTTALALKATIASPTFTGGARVNGDFTVGAATGEDKFVVAPQAAGSGTFVISYNDAGNAYEPLTADFETLALRTSGTPRLSIDSSGTIALAGDLTTTGTIDGVDIAARDAVLTSTTTTAGAALPKAGGTLTGALIGTSATFSPSSGKTFVIASDSGDGPYIGTSGNQSLRIITNNATRMTIAAAGDVNVPGNITVGGTVDGVDIAARDAVLTSTTTTAGAALPKAGGTMTGTLTTPTLITGAYGGSGSAGDGFRLNSTDLYGQIDASDKIRLNVNGDSFLNGGNVGIGTNSPAVALDIAGSSTTQMRIQMSGQADTRVLSDTGTGIIGTYSNHPLTIKTNSSIAATIDTSGNVGIGTTDQIGEKLTVNGSVQVLGNNDPNYSAKFISGYDSTHGLRITTRINDTTESEVLGVFAESGGSSPRLVLNPTNGWKVGIGVTAPTHTLNTVGASGTSVVQSIRNPSTSWGQYALTRYGTEGADFRYMDFGYYRGAAEGTRGLVIKSQADATLVTFLDDGKVGIGTNTPTEKLEVDGGIKISNGNSRLYFGTEGGTSYRALEGSTNGSLLQVGENYTDIALQGNVGIGTSAPYGRLELKGSGNLWTTAPVIRMWDDLNSKGWLVGTANNITPGDFYIRTLPSISGTPGSTEQEFTIQHSTGNVGIGTTAPSETLVVSGDALVTGQMYLGPNTVSRRPFAKTTNWGYSTGYRAVVLGSASTDYSTSISGAVTLSFNYDPSVNPNGAFSGNGNEIIFRNGTQFVTPNAANDSFNLRNLVLKDGDVLIGSDTNLNVLSGTPKLQIGSGTGNASLQFYSGTGSVNGMYFGDNTTGTSRYSGYIEYRHNDNTMAFRAADRSVMTLYSRGPLLPAGDFAYHSTQEHYTNPSSPGSYSTATNTAYNSSTEYWPDQGEKLVCVINARAFTRYLHIKTNLTANNIMFYFRTKGYFYSYGMEEQLVGGYTYYSGSNLILSKDNKTVAGDTHSGDTYRATDGSLVLKMDINHQGYTEGKMLVFFGAHSPSIVSGLTVVAVTQKDDGTNAF